MKKLKTFLEYLMEMAAIEKHEFKNPNIAHSYGLLECGVEFECYLQPLTKFKELKVKEPEHSLVKYIDSVILNKIKDHYDISKMEIRVFLREWFDPLEFNFTERSLKEKFVEKKINTQIKATSIFGDNYHRPSATVFILELQKHPKFKNKYGQETDPKLTPKEFLDFFEIEPRFGWDNEEKTIFKRAPDAYEEVIDYTTLKDIEYLIIEKQIQEVFKDDRIHLHNKPSASGGQTKVFKHYHLDQNTKIENPHFWYLESDSSLNSDLGFAVEIISPHWKPSVLLERIKLFKEGVFDFFYGKTDSTTSMHCSFKTPGGAILNPVKLLMLLEENTHLGTFERLSNQYTKPHLTNYLQLLNKLVDPKNNELFKELKQDDKGNWIITKEQENYIRIVSEEYLNSTGKYVTVKFKDYNFENGSGRVEFRIIGNDYFGSKYTSLDSTLEHFISVMVASLDKEWFHQEYINTLFNYISTFSNKDIILLRDIITMFLSKPIDYKISNQGLFSEIIKKLLILYDKLGEINLKTVLNNTELNSKIFDKFFEFFNKYCFDVKTEMKKYDPKQKLNNVIVSSELNKTEIKDKQYYNNITKLINLTSIINSSNFIKKFKEWWTNEIKDNYPELLIIFAEICDTDSKYIRIISANKKALEKEFPNNKEIQSFLTHVLG